MYIKFPLDNFHLQDPSIVQSGEMPTKSCFIETFILFCSGYKSSGGVHRKTDLYLKENDHIRK
jgi:hypothetical protein